MKNNECSNCQMRNDLHKAFFGVGIKKGLCLECAKDKVVVEVKVETVEPKNVSNNESKWSPEIAEAMRYQPRW